MEPTQKAITFYNPYIAGPPITDITAIEAELSELGQNITLFQFPQSE